MGTVAELLRKAERIGALTRVPALHETELQQEFQRLPRGLASEFLELYRFCNGGEFCGLTLMSASEWIEYEELLPFHNWGNGDSDAIRFDGMAEPGSIWFVNHGPQCVVRIASTLS